MRFIFRFSFVVSVLFSSQGFAVGDGHFYKGADEIVAKSKLPLFYQPSQRFSLIQILSNARFFGNLGIWKPQIPVHVQALDPKGAPQTYTDALFQLFFPSPDGVNLTANQASSDPIGQLTLHDVVMLIKLSSTNQLTEKDLLNVFPKSKFDEEIRKDYPQFLRYEFMRQIFQEIDLTGDSIYETLGIDPQDPQKYSKIFDKVLPQYKKLGLIKDNEIENYAKANRISQLVFIQKPSNKQKLELDELQTQFPQFFVFESKRSDFLTFRFVDTFLKASQEVGYLFEKPIEKALLGYMWLKFKTPEEQSEFYHLMGVDGLAKIFKQDGYNFKDYQSLKTQSVDTLNREEIALIKYGYDLFENPFPPTIPYGNATIHVNKKNVTFSDSVEASILSLVLYKARQLKEGSYQIDPNVFSEKSLLNGFFRRYTTLDQLFSIDAHNDFAQILAELKNVKYLKPSGNAPKTYEVKPGLINSFHVLGELIPELSVLSSLSEKSSFKSISNGMEILCSYMFPRDEKWTWSGFEEDSNLLEKGDIFESIFFLKETGSVLKWEHDPQHASMECLAPQAKRFDKTACECLMKDPLKHSFVDLMDLVESGDLSKGLSEIFLSTDYRSALVKTHGAHYIFSLNLEALKPLGFSLVRALAEADEDSMNVGIAWQFCSWITTKTLSEINVKRILLENPSLLGLQILTDFEKHTFEFVANTLLSQGHEDWLIEVAPECKNLAINGNQTEILKSLLPRFSSLLSIGLYSEDLNILKACFEEGNFKTNNLIVVLTVKSFDPSHSWFQAWLQEQKKKVQIFPLSLVSSNSEDCENQLIQLFKKPSQLEIDPVYLKGDELILFNKALSSHNSKEEEIE
ncbi:hypothetical protein Bealeia1_00108 [Candidatus Bealeia paramacronuclearis]|uniref:Uncharacterized protein n=1 Tax=Candidatus Bealeia paramacronuclearis TaxID=1921001 RepID=A0ABZ2C3C8_9PROT|nr:hypothetical protein [Candidatus Bealeia paramacronuclearis]